MGEEEKYIWKVHAEVPFATAFLQMQEVAGKIFRQFAGPAREATIAFALRVGTLQQLIAGAPKAPQLTLACSEQQIQQMHGMFLYLFAISQ